MSQAAHFCRGSLAVGGTWPSSLLVGQFISNGSVYVLCSCGRLAKQAVNYCGCSTFSVINISANHGQSQLRDKEADREASSGQFILNTD